MRLAITRRPLAMLAALALVGAAACVGDGDSVPTGATVPAGGALFARYVSLGNSITAGFQSNGIVDSLQKNSYPNFLAARAGAVFYQPLLQGEGCPKPFTGPLTPAPAAPAGSPCARVDVSPFTSNLAVPGVRIADLFATPADPTSAFQRLYGILTGGRSEVSAMIATKPTFVSVWVGNNDALSAALSGQLGPLAAGADSNLTRLAPFQARVTQLADSIKASGAQGAALIGVVFADSASPLLQPGAYFYLARDVATGKFNGKTVNANCSPVTILGTPNPLAANLVSFQIVGDAAFPEINCDPNAYPVGDPRRGTYLLDTSERAVLDQRIAQYNAAIKAAADANGWVYVNPMDILRPELARTTTVAGGPRYQQIRKCQTLNAALASGSAANIQTALLSSCPVTGATGAPNFFGALISYDGVHPSTAAHVIIARFLAGAINTKYGTALNTA